MFLPPFGTDVTLNMATPYELTVTFRGFTPLNLLVVTSATHDATAVRTLRTRITHSSFGPWKPKLAVGLAKVRRVGGVHEISRARLSAVRLSILASSPASEAKEFCFGFV